MRCARKLLRYKWTGHFKHNTNKHKTWTCRSAKSNVDMLPRGKLTSYHFNVCRLSRIKRSARVCLAWIQETKARNETNTKPKLEPQTWNAHKSTPSSPSYSSPISISHSSNPTSRHYCSSMYSMPMNIMISCLYSYILTLYHQFIISSWILFLHKGQLSLFFNH